MRYQASLVIFRNERVIDIERFNTSFPEFFYENVDMILSRYIRSVTVSVTEIYKNKGYKGIHCENDIHRYCLRCDCCRG